MAIFVSRNIGEPTSGHFNKTFTKPYSYTNMKKLLLSIFLLTSVIESQAQLLVGSTAPDFTITDLEGNTWNYSAMQQNGYSLVMVIGLPENYWQLYEMSFQLNNMYNQFGPTGSQELMVLYINPFESTDEELIESTIPDYFDFPTVNASSEFLSLLNVPIPTFHYCEVICPSGLVQEQNSMYSNNIYSESILQDCQNIVPQNDLSIGYCYYDDCSNQLWTSVHNPGTVSGFNVQVEFFVDGISYGIATISEVLPNEQTFAILNTVEISTDMIVYGNIVNSDEVEINNQSGSLFTQGLSASNHLVFEATNSIDTELYYHISIQGETDLNYFQDFDVVVPPMSNLQTHVFLPPTGCYSFFYFDSGITEILNIDLFYENNMGQLNLLDDSIQFNQFNPEQSTAFEIGSTVPFNLSGTVFHDQNEDGIKDSFEPGIGGVEVHLGTQITYTDENGHYTFPDVNIEDYTELSIVYDETLWPVATTGTTIPIDNGMMSNFNFGLSNNDPFYLLQSYTSDPWFFCGFDGQLYISVSNEGYMAASGTLTATLDPLLTYTGASPTPLSFVGNTIVWDISTLPVGGNAYFYVNVVAPTFEQMGETMTTTLNIITYDSDGIEVANNTIENSGNINCSYDPNDITGIPAGETDAHFIHNGTQLEYLVRFQNTGNYQAFDIRVDDQLDSDLDFSTFEFVSSSHACVPVFNTETGFIQFYFNDINLPDSTTNEAASHGWLRYRISPQTPLAEMTIIENTAYIYFDFNPAVVTNTYVHTISDLYFGLDEIAIPTISLYPNPANQTVLCNFNSNRFQSINVIDLSGKIILKESNLSNGQTTISTANLAEGVYIIEALRKDGMTSAHARLVIQH